MTMTRTEMYTRRRLTVKEYERMAEAGILGEDDRIELIEGELIEMAAIGRRHMECVTELTWLLHLPGKTEYRVSVQNPVIASEYSVPQPDIVVLKSSYRQKKAVPDPSEILLLIEVADSSLEYDRSTKGSLYARAGISPYWIVNLVDNRIEVYTQPVAGAYQTMTTYDLEDAVPLDPFPGSLIVREIIPAPE